MELLDKLELFAHGRRPTRTAFQWEEIRPDAFSLLTNELVNIEDGSDIVQFAMGYAFPRIEAIDDLTQEFDALMRTPTLAVRLRAILPFLTSEMEKMHLMIRKNLFKTHRAYGKLSHTQRAVHIASFVSLLRVVRLRAVVEGGELGNRKIRDYTFCQQTDELASRMVDSKARELPHELSVLKLDRSLPSLVVKTKDERIATFSLEEVQIAMKQLQKTLQMVGASCEGALTYWRALWHRTSQLLDLHEPEGEESESEAMEQAQSQLRMELTPEMRATLTSLAANIGLSGANVDELINMRSAGDIRGLLDSSTLTEEEEKSADVELKGYLPEPLPIVHSGRRLKYVAISIMEARFLAYEQRFRVLGEFEKALSHQASKKVAAQLKANALCKEAATVIRHLISWLSMHHTDMCSRLLREHTSSNAFAPFLHPADTEAYTMQRIDISKLHILKEIVGKHSDASEVLSRLHLVEYMKIARLVDGGEGLLLKLVDLDFLAEEAASGPLPVARVSEQIAVMLLPVVVLASLSIVGCKTDVPLISHFYIDETQGNRHTILPFTDPATALERYGGSARVVVVRLLRRNFIVTRVGSKLVTLDTHGFSLSLLLWMAWTRSNIHKTLPEPISAFVNKFRV